MVFFLVYRRILRILRRAIFIDCPGRERVSASPKTLWAIYNIPEEITGEWRRETRAGTMDMN